MFLRKTKLCEYSNKNFIMYLQTFTKLCHYGIFRSEKLCLTNDSHFHKHKFCSVYLKLASTFTKVSSPISRIFSRIVVFNSLSVRSFSINP